MQNSIGFWIKAALLGISLGLTMGSGGALAQGSAGGSIGNDDKAVSGSRPEPRAVERERPAARERPARSRQAEEPRRPAPRRGGGSGGGGGSFDGAWSISSAGVTCSDTFQETVVVTSGKLVGNYGGGSVSASGSVSGSGNYNGIGVTSQGRFSGRSGSGTFQRSDGCTGRWTASKL